MLFDLPRTAQKPRWIRLATIICLAVTFATSAEEPVCRADEPKTAKKFEESWQVIYLGNSRIGYSRSNSQAFTRDGRELMKTETEAVLVIARFGQEVKTRTLLTTEETVDGNLLTFRNETSNPPADTTTTTGRVDNGKLYLETITGGKKTTRSMTWDPTWKSPGFVDRGLRENPLKPGESRSFKSFSTEFNTATTYTLTAGEKEDVELLGNKTRNLLKVKIDQSVAPGLSVTEYLDDEGSAQKASLGLLGIAMYTVSKEEALKKLSGQEVDMGLSTIVKATGLKDAREASQFVYRVRIPNEDLTKILDQGSTQSLKVVEKGVGDLTVKVVKPPRSAAATKENLSQYLAPNRYIQSDDELVIKRAEEAVGSETDPWQSALKMEKWVYSNLKQKNFSTLLASAAEVAKSLSGDCTEHAVLLAGMARVKKIPSRCVVGLLYVPQLGGFGGHMWTEVHINGTWIPLDATLGRGVVAPDHIKFSHTSFSDEGDTAALSTFIPLVSVLGKLSLEVKSVEK